MTTGEEWIVEAYGCDAARLGDPAALAALFDACVHELELHPVGEAMWHRFPAPGGVTGMRMLAESHLTVHTFPEHGAACVNLFCCVPRAPWDWRAALHAALGAREVVVRVVPREYAAVPAVITPVPAAVPASAAASPT